VTYQRHPFFLRPTEAAIQQWLGSKGLARDATRGEVIGDRIDHLFQQAGLDATGGRPNPFGVLTMDSHRLAMHAAKKDWQLGERMWKATSRRYFEGKDTELLGKERRLDNQELLFESAREVGLDLEEVKKVLADTSMYRDDIIANVQAVQDVGIHAIPVLIFEAEQLCQGSNWLEDPRAAWPDDGNYRMRELHERAALQFPGREIHHGSGNKAAFKAIFRKLHDACHNARM